MASICTIKGCSSVTVGRGWCRKHYLRWYHHGDPLYVERIRGDDVARYWSHVDRRGPDDCWIWTGHTRRGYGLIGIGGKSKSAHRWAYEQFIGPIPTDLKICHICDNPPCQNPAHWFLGTYADNNADKVAKGRQTSHNRWGDRDPKSRLTERDVADIRLLASAGLVRNRDLAVAYGISQSYVSKIIHWHDRKHG